MAGSGNLISGNTGWGIEYSGYPSVSLGLVIQGNLIGTDMTGTVALGNGSGIDLLATGHPCRRHDRAPRRM